jgi:hypothetical protein
MLGKGPKKQYYEKIFANKSYSHITVFFKWLQIDDYPKLLGIN